MTKKRRKTPNFISLFFLSFLLNFNFACQKAEFTPDKIISSQTMTSILIEMHLAEAYIIESRFKIEDSARVAFKQMEKEIFKKYNTDSSRYARSYQYYALNIEKLDKIYSAVVDSLSERENQLKQTKKIKEAKEIAKEKQQQPINAKRSELSKEIKQTSQSIKK